MRTALVAVMFLNAAVFVFAAVLHAGISIGGLHEPRIVPATIVEMICASALAWGSVSILTRSPRAWRAALSGNLVALSGVLLGKAALAAGRGPRTPSNDLYHNVMLVLIGVSIVLCVAARKTLRMR